MTDPFYPRFWPEKLKEINQDPYKNFSESSHQRAYRGKRRSKPRGIFVSDMGDLFGLGVPEDWTRQVLDAIRADPVDRFYLLTKQSQNLAKFSPFPANCWVGISVDGAANRIWRAYSGHFERVKAAVKFLSLEPLLGDDAVGSDEFQILGVSWVIIGAQTRPTVMPRDWWVKNIVQACDQAGVKVWLKNSLHKLLWDDDLPGYPAWAADNNDVEKLRQEMPKGE